MQHYDMLSHLTRERQALRLRQAQAEWLARESRPAAPARRGRPSLAELALALTARRRTARSHAGA